MLEVKSPNDRLADKQRIWLHVLHHLGADVGVCHVTTSGARNFWADSRNKVKGSGASAKRRSSNRDGEVEDEE